MIRKDLVYRQIEQDARAEAAEVEPEPEEFSYLNDRRLDSITDKVIQYMDETPVERWENEQWGLFKLLWTSRKSMMTKKKTAEPEPEPKEQTTEELQRVLASMNSAAA